MRDGAEVLDHFALAHANAGIGESDRVLLLISLDGNAERQGRLKDRLAGGLEEAELLTGIGGVGDQLANKDFFIRVKRVDDDIQQLLNLSLEVMFFGGSHSC